jgi:hypothetical protein
MTVWNKARERQLAPTRKYKAVGPVGTPLTAAMTAASVGPWTCEDCGYHVCNCKFVPCARCMKDEATHLEYCMFCYLQTWRERTTR